MSNNRRQGVRVCVCVLVMHENMQKQRPPFLVFMLPSGDSAFILSANTEASEIYSAEHSSVRDPVDCSPPDSSAHGVLQAMILDWVAMPSSRGSSRPSDLTQVWQNLYRLSHQGSPLFRYLILQSFQKPRLEATSDMDISVFFFLFFFKENLPAKYSQTPEGCQAATCGLRVTSLAGCCLRTN